MAYDGPCDPGTPCRRREGNVEAPPHLATAWRLSHSDSGNGSVDSGKRLAEAGRQCRWSAGAALLRGEGRGGTAEQGGAGPVGETKRARAPEQHAGARRDPDVTEVDRRQNRQHG